MPNTTALAMAPHGAVAGSASALLGSIQFILGRVAGALVGALGNGTAVPLAVVIAGCGASAFAIQMFGLRRPHIGCCFRGKARQRRAEM